MLHELKSLKSKMKKKEAKDKIKKLQEDISALQLPLSKTSSGVVIVFEGFSASGKGQMIANLITELDPRFYQVHSTPKITDTERRLPFFHPFWSKLPLKGNIAIFDRSWYNRAVNEDKQEEFADDINTFERQLVDDGYLVLKFFLYISKQEQKTRLKALQDDDFTSWRVTDRDIKLNKDYDDRFDMIDNLLTDTSTNYSEWYPIWNENEWEGTLKVLTTVHDKIKKVIEKGVKQTKPTEYKFPLIKMPLLDDLELRANITDDYYKKALKIEKASLSRLHSAIYKEKIPVVIAFEGWDAAGKGGAIRRLSWALDPRGFDVIPIAAPSFEAKNRHYLWRFWNEIPKDGHIAIFDRSWYGRVMVERVEKFTPNSRCIQAFREINEFEKNLADWGAIVLKFWIHIDKDEQLKRFTERQNTPEKQYKITDEDWRNREKWDKYEVAVNEMLQKTSTEYAPWIIVEGNDKKYARIKILETIKKAFEQKLKSLNDE